MDEKKPRGRPSKGPRRTFAVKLDLERAAKLTEILEIRGLTGVGYLTCIIEAHLDAIDLDQLRDQTREPRAAVAAEPTTPAPRATVKRKPTREDELRRAQTLARKVNLLLDSIMDDSGQPYDYPAIEVGSKRAGFYISRTRWSLLKEGKVQVVPDSCLRAVATVFRVDPEYLLNNDAELPAEVEAMLPQVRLKRLSEVRDFAVKALGGPVDPERLEALTKFLDQALEP